MSENEPLSERIKWKDFRLHPADRDSVVVSKATLDRWINEIAAWEQRLAEAEAELSRKDECIVDGLMQRKDLQSRLAEAKQLYMELLFAVARKYPNETRHETALRYIMERESREFSGPHQDNPKHGLPGSCT